MVVWNFIYISCFDVLWEIEFIIIVKIRKAFLKKLFDAIWAMPDAKGAISRPTLKKNSEKCNELLWE